MKLIIQFVLAMMTCSIIIVSPIKVHHKQLHHKSHVRQKASVLKARAQMRSQLFNADAFGGGDFRRLNRIVNKPDNWDKIPYLFQTYNEPNLDSYYLMPSLSNGYVGTVAFNDSVYLNGFYNGRNGRSHRVRVPSMNSVYAFFDSTDLDEVPSYTLNCRRGMYVKEVRNSQNSALMTQRLYVHRRIKNLIINEIRVEILNAANDNPISIELHNSTKLLLDYVNTYDIESNPNRHSFYYQDGNPESMSYELKVVKPPTLLSRFIDANDGIYHLRSVIPELEEDNNVNRKKEINIYYTNVPQRLQVYKNSTFKTFHFIMSVGRDQTETYRAYEEALRIVQVDPNGLFSTHVNAWEELWQKNGFAMVGDNTPFMDANQDSFKLAQRLYSSFYNLYSQIPFSLNWSPDNQFYGLSAAGLSYGALKQEYYNASVPALNRRVAEGYGGHTMYTQDVWILPLISLFSQDMAKSILQSRMRRVSPNELKTILDVAREQAQAETAEGIKYSWEQADFGKDITAWQEAKRKKLHVTGDVGFGLRSYLRMSHDRDFLLNSMSSDAKLKGEEFVHELAKYWNSKLVTNPNKQLYEVKDVIFGDQNVQRDVNSDAYTNYLAKVNIESYKYSLRLMEKNPYDQIYSYKIRDYDDKVRNLFMPYDGSRKLYLEFENANPAQLNYETWVPFLNYPLQMNLSYIEKKNLLDIYAPQIGNDGKNTMSYASFVVGYLEVKDEPKARDYFNRLSNHFNGPFLVMSEYPNYLNNLNPMNTFNYLPGYAAFLHAFIGGYSGLRVRDFQLDIVYPSEHFTGYTSSSPSSQFYKSLPIKAPYQSVDYWNITGLSYRGFEIDIIYNLRGKQVIIINRRLTEGYSTLNTKPLEMIIYENNQITNKTFNLGETVIININTDLWSKDRVWKRNYEREYYSDNIDALVTIYSPQFRDYIILDNGFSRLSMRFHTIIVCLVASLMSRL